MTGPLRGVRVLEVAEHSFVPSAVAVLGDWGADVVKVERPAGDANRRNMKWGYVPDTGDIDTTWEQVNRNKRGIVLDLAAPAGRDALDRLLTWADVFVTNQLPDVRRKLRLDPADVHAVNPRLVYAKGHGFGQRGPQAAEGGYDFIGYWARAAIGHLLTPLGAPPPNPRPAFGDVISGMFLAGGIAAALVGVARTGEGTVVDLSLLASGIWSTGVDHAATSVLQVDPPRYDPQAVLFSPLVGYYETADGRWLSFSMLDEARYWPAFCAAVAPADLSAFDDPAVREAERPALKQRLRELLASRPAAEWRARFDEHHLIYAVLSTALEVQTDAQVVANGYLPRHPDHPTARLAASPVQFDDRLPEVRRAAPRQGQHTDEVLAEVGFGTDEIAALRGAGALGDT